MRSIITIITLLTTINLCQAQQVVKWSAVYNGDCHCILIDANMEQNWVIYSQHTDPDGPIPLEFEFEAIEGVSFVGEVVEMTEPIEKMSEMFGVTVRKFKEKAEFKQSITGHKAGQTIKGNVTFMACDDEKCLPPETVPFEVKL